MQTLPGAATLLAKPTGVCNDRLSNYCNRSSGGNYCCCQGLDSHKDLRQQNET